MYEDFYNSTSEYDMFMDELKENLKKAVKKEVLDELNKLKEENQQLHDVKVNFEKIKLEYARKERELEAKERSMKENLARKRIDELTTIADLQPEVYCLDSQSARVPKCGECDEKRLIHFKSPSGKDCTEECPVCGHTYTKYFVKPLDALRIKFSSDPRAAREAFFIKSDEWGERTTYKKADIYNGAVEDFDYGYFNLRRACFESKDFAQKICDKANEKAGVPLNAEPIKS